jgi:hypothetical protein
MTAINPPYVCQGRTDHPAQLFRLALAGAAGAPFAAGGTSPAGGVDPYLGQAMAITGLASMNVQVGTGLVYIPNTTAWNGMYAGYNTATFNVPIAASSSTQWRSDYIVAQVTDPGDNTANWQVSSVAGAFSSSSPGALPALPANSIPLAIIRVVPNMSVTNGGGTVVDARVFNGLKGVFPTTSANKPSLTCPNGTMWYESDTQLLGMLIGGARKYVAFTSQLTSNDPWHAFNPLSNSWAVGGGGWAQYRYANDGRSVKISAKGLTLGTKTDGTIVSSNFPAGYRPINNHEFPVATDAIPAPTTAGTPRMTLDTSGNLKCFGFLGSTGVEVSWDVEVPLDL